MLEGWLSFNGSGWYILALKGVEGVDKRMAGGLSIQHAMVACLFCSGNGLRGCCCETAKS